MRRAFGFGTQGMRIEALRLRAEFHPAQQIALCQDADDSAIVHHWDSADAVLQHQHNDLIEWRVRTNRDDVRRHDIGGVHAFLQPYYCGTSIRALAGGRLDLCQRALAVAVIGQSDDRQRAHSHFGEAQREFFVELMQTAHIGINNDLRAVGLRGVGDVSGELIAVLRGQNDVFAICCAA